MFNPYDTQEVVKFLATHASAVQESGGTATGVLNLVSKVDTRVQRHRDAKQLLKHSASQLIDAGWTHNDVVCCKVKWPKLVRHHGAHDLVQTLGMTMHDAKELGMTATQLLRMSSDLLGAWNVRAHDMIALGATVPQLLDRYETGDNLADMGFTANIMCQMGMPKDKADALFAGVSASRATNNNAVAASAQSGAETLEIPGTAAALPPSKRLEHVTLDDSTVLDF